MKYVLPALPVLAAAVCALSACQTSSDRFDLFSPDKPHGPATDRLRDYTLGYRNDHASSISTYPVSQPAEESGSTGEETAAPPAPDETAPVVQPAPALPTTTSPSPAVGAPAATPIPQAAPPTSVPGLGTPPAASAPPASSAPPTSSTPPTDNGGAGGAAIPGLSQ